MHIERVNVDGHTQVATFRREDAEWTVYEDLRTREGAINVEKGSAEREANMWRFARAARELLERALKQ